MRLVAIHQRFTEAEYRADVEARRAEFGDGLTAAEMVRWETVVDGRNEVAGHPVAARAPTARSITPAPSGCQRRTDTGPGRGFVRDLRP